MATVTLDFTATWITDALTLESVQVRKTARVETDQRDVQVRPYGERLRIISTLKRERTTPLIFRRVSETDLETLRDWAGRVLLLRDAQGWHRWGTYAGIAPVCVVFAPELPLYDVSLTWQDITHSDAV